MTKITNIYIHQSFQFQVCTWKHLPRHTLLSLGTLILIAGLLYFGPLPCTFWVTPSQLCGPIGVLGGHGQHLPTALGDSQSYDGGRWAVVGDGNGRGKGFFYTFFLLLCYFSFIFYLFTMQHHIMLLIIGYPELHLLALVLEAPHQHPPTFSSRARERSAWLHGDPDAYWDIPYQN